MTKLHTVVTFLTLQKSIQFFLFFQSSIIQISIIKFKFKKIYYISNRDFILYLSNLKIFSCILFKYLCLSLFFVFIYIFVLFFILI